MMGERWGWSRWIVVGFAAFACGPSAGPDDAFGSGTTTGAPPSHPTPPSSQTSTTGVASSQSSDAEGDADSSFIVAPDGGGVCIALPDGTVAHCPWPCSPFRQDCPAGAKCMPYASDGGPAWNATRCVEIARDPSTIGESCAVQGSAVAGIDDCDIGAMCFHVDPETNEGTCVGMCMGSALKPICDPGLTCTIRNEAVLTLCLPSCNPLIDDCDEDQVCAPGESDFGCVPQGDPVPNGEPCDLHDQCVAGSSCIDGELADCGEESCCSAYCDLAVPNPHAVCGDGKVCAAWFEPGRGPPALQSLGICVAR